MALDGVGGSRRNGSSVATRFENGEIMSVEIDRVETIKKAKRFLTSFETSQVIDDIALRIAGAANKSARIEAAAEEFAAEMKRVGCGELFTRYCRATFTLVLAEKIKVAEAAEGGRA